MIKKMEKVIEHLVVGEYIESYQKKGKISPVALKLLIKNKVFIPAIQQAKEELLDDWIRRLNDATLENAIFPLAGQKFRNKVIEFIKKEKRHLSTFASQKETNSSFIQDCSVKCPVNLNGRCQVNVANCEPYNSSKQS